MTLQTLHERQEADARLSPFMGRRSQQVAKVAALLALFFVGKVVWTSFVQTSQPGVVAVDIDFRVFWAAAKLALSGEPFASFDLQRLASVHATNTGAYLPWLYPPGFLVLLTPFGAMPFSIAFLVWTILSIVMITLAARPFVAGITPLWILMSLAPAYYPALLLGQNSLLWAAGLLASLACLRSERWVIAGILLGCLTLKPQLGLMIPIALLAIGAWRTIFAAIATTLFLAGLPTLIYGIGYWPLLKDGIFEHSAWVVLSTGSNLAMISPFGFSVFLGVDPALSLELQLLASAALALAVYALWRSRQVGFDVKAAGLLCAIMLSAPYLFYYEAALMPAIALFLLRGGVLATRATQLAFLSLLWIGGVLLVLGWLATVIDPRWFGAAAIPTLVLICLGLCLWRLAPSRASGLNQI